MKSIKKLSEELGVSKQAIRNKIAKLGLQSSLQKNGNQFLIDEETEAIIKADFSEKGKEKTSQDVEHTAEHESQTTLQLIAMLQNELDQKNKQIAELQKIIDQEQQLRLVEHKRILELEDQLHKNNDEVKEVAEPHIQEDFSSEPKMKWWQKLFK